MSFLSSGSLLSRDRPVRSTCTPLNPVKSLPVQRQRVMDTGREAIHTGAGGKPLRKLPRVPFAASEHQNSVFFPFGGDTKKLAYFHQVAE